MAKTFAEIERLVERYDEAQRNLDEAVADRIAMALDAAYRNLERELRALYPQWESQGSLYAVQRRLLLMDALGDALNIIRPEQQAEYEKLFTEALNISHMNGGTLAGELIRAREPGYPLQEFTAIPVEAAVAQARDGVKRLYRHSEDFRSAASGIVEQGLIQGWGTGKVAKALRDQVGATKSKAETIARTEMSSAFNTAAKQRYQENGIELVQWFTTSSDRLCFPASVMVETEAGPRPISEIKVGDNVLTRDGFKRVAKVYERPYAGDLVQVVSGGWSVCATPNHPFLTGRGWLPAEKLCDGDTIQTVNNELVQVTGIHYIRFKQSQDDPSGLSQSRVLPGISRRILVPVNPVGFNGDLDLREGKVEGISTKLEFLDKIKVKLSQGFPNKLFQSRLPAVFAVAGNGAESPSPNQARHYSKRLGASQAVDFARRPITFFGAISPWPPSRKRHKLSTPVAMPRYPTGALADISAFHATAENLKPRFTDVKSFAAYKARTLLSVALHLLPVGIAVASAKLLTMLDAKGASTPSTVSRLSGGLTIAIQRTEFSDPPSVSDGKLRTAIRAGDSFTEVRSARLFPFLPFAKGYATTVGAKLTGLCSLTQRGKSDSASFTIKGGGRHELCDLQDQYTHSTTVDEPFMVYNLSVEGLPEYYANGFLVHNCSYCLSREGKVYRIEDVIIPAHPRCRCLSVPYSEKWQQRGWTDDEAVTEIHQQRLDEMAALGTTPTDRPTPWERQRGMTSAPKPVWSPGDAVVKPTAQPTAQPPTPRRNPGTALPQNHVVSNNPRLSGDALNDGLNAIRTEGGAERAQMFRDFVNRNNIQVLIHDPDLSNSDWLKVVEAQLQDKAFVTTFGNLREHVIADPTAAGYTNAYYNHLVITSTARGREGRFTVDGTRLKAQSDNLLTTAGLDDTLGATTSRLLHRDSREFVTYMHEMGHQVYFKGGIPTIPDDIAGSVTDYGAQNEHEWFAEHFALWMMDAQGYAALDPVGAAFIRQTLVNATTNPVTIQELEAR